MEVQPHLLQMAHAILIVVIHGACRANPFSVFIRELYQDHQHMYLLQVIVEQCLASSTTDGHKASLKSLHRSEGVNCIVTLTLAEFARNTLDAITLWLHIMMVCMCRVWILQALCTNFGLLQDTWTVDGNFMLTEMLVTKTDFGWTLKINLEIAGTDWINFIVN